MRESERVKRAASGASSSAVLPLACRKRRPALLLR